MNRTLFLSSLCLTTALAAVACGDDTGEGGGGGSSTTTASTSQTSSSQASTTASTTASTAQASSSTGGAMIEAKIPFEARIGAEVFDCAGSYMLGTPPVEMEVTDFRLYLHDVELVDHDGNIVPLPLADGPFQNAGVVLLDFEDKTGACANGTAELHTELSGMVPDVHYHSVRFKVGVPAARNHADAATAPSPLNLTSMFWSWAEGYKFVRIDARSANAPPTPFFLHLGSTGCSGDPVTCTNLNVPEVQLDIELGQKVVVDFAALVQDVDIATPGGGAPGCMSGVDDPECEPIFPALGLVLASGMPAATQSLFRVE